MKAIEFETTTQKHSIRIPDTIPDGTHLRVLLLMDDAPVSDIPEAEVKHLLATLTEGLTDEDLHRPRDFGRGELQWDS